MQLLQEWVTAQAQARPDATAVVCGAARLTYRELEAQSNQLARVLTEAGCRQGEPIAVLMPRSLSAVVAMVAIGKVDGVYVPLEPSSPSGRLRKMIAICGITRMLAAGSVGPIVNELVQEESSSNRLRIGWLDGDVPRDLAVEFRLEDLAVYSADPVQMRNRAFHPGFVFFTSGSSGTPKGVILTHANLISAVEWMTHHFGIDPSDRVSCHWPLHVDMSVIDVFTAFAAGAELHLVPAIVSVLPNNLAEFIRSSGITHWSSMPSVLSYMAQFDLVKAESFPQLKRVLWSGDVLPTPTLMHWMKGLPHVTFTHLYGQPETTAVNSFYTVPACPQDVNESIPVGAPCAGGHLLVLDASMKPVARGGIGDLYIGGAGVSRGYWGDLAQTNAGFVRHPERLNERLYRTGDLARVDANGLIHLEGRRDLQIKTRGHRIELGEIETALHAIGTLKDAAVIALNRGGFDGALICCAYVPATTHDANPILLRRELSRHVPSYMLPVHWMAMGELPIDSAGRVDRCRLTALFEERLRTHERRPVA